MLICCVFIGVTWADSTNNYIYTCLKKNKKEEKGGLGGGFTDLTYVD